jgi:hypothetical protein
LADGINRASQNELVQLSFRSRNIANLGQDNAAFACFETHDILPLLNVPSRLEPTSTPLAGSGKIRKGLEHRRKPILQP